MARNKQFSTNRILSLLVMSGALTLTACGGSNGSTMADQLNLDTQEQSQPTTESQPVATETETNTENGNTVDTPQATPVDNPGSVTDEPVQNVESSTRLELKRLHRSIESEPVFNAEKTAHNFVIQNATRWETVWNKLQMGNKNPAAMPMIDFNSKQVIGIQRTLNNACLDGHIASISNQSETTTAHVRISEPKPGTKCAQAIRYAVHFVETDKTATEVLFEDTTSQEMALRKFLELTSTTPFTDMNEPYKNHVINSAAEWAGIEQKLKAQFGDELKVPKINWEKKRIVGIEREMKMPCMKITMASAIALPNSAVVRVESTHPSEKEAKKMKCMPGPLYLTEFKTIDRMPENVRFRDLAIKVVNPE